LVAGDLYFPGRIDEVAVYASALSSAQVQTHYAAAFQSSAAPRFTLQPQSRATLAGSSYTLSAKVHSTPPVGYQWLQNGAGLTGATNSTLVLGSVGSASAGSYQLVATHGSSSATNAATQLQILSGEAVNVDIEGFEITRVIGANGKYAGYVALSNWNEIAYNSNGGSVTGLVNSAGQTNNMIVSWTAGGNRRWNGPFGLPSGDFALLNGFLEATAGTNITLTISGIPANYQSAGYSLYVYMGEPSATVGAVGASDSFAFVSVGTATNYYHGEDLAYWDGSYTLATTTDISQAPADANYALFTNLNSASVTVTVAPDPNFTGPSSLSGFQLVANVVPPVPLAMYRSGGNIFLSWSGNWVLQKKSALDNNPNSWSDVGGAASPYQIPAPLATEQFYRLRSP
jgi:hypothetical protein